jgi:hypothetical protein
VLIASASPDWPTIIAAIGLLFAAIAAGSAAWAIHEARASGRDLKAAASTLEKVLGQEHELAELQRQAVAEQRTMAAETWLRHRLDALLAVEVALLHVISYWRAAERMGVLKRWRETQMPPAVTDPDSGAVSRVQEAQVELMTALRTFPADELPSVYAQAQQSPLFAKDGENASLIEIHSEVTKVKEELHRLALRHPVGHPPGQLGGPSNG